MCLFYIILLAFTFSQEAFSFITPEQIENGISTHLIKIINSLDNSTTNVVTILRFNKKLSQKVHYIIDDTVRDIRKDILVYVNVQDPLIYKTTRMLIVFYGNGLFQVCCF